MDLAEPAVHPILAFSMLRHFHTQCTAEGTPAHTQIASKGKFALDVLY